MGESAHCFLRSSPPLLASFSRLHHLALPVLHLPAPLLALTRLSSVALAVLCPLCPALLASPAPFHRLTRLSSLALHLGASDDCHPCPMCTVTDTAHGSTSGSSSSHGSGGGAGGGSSASTAKPSTSLTALSPLTDLFSGLSPSLTSLTYSPLRFLPPRPPLSPPRSSPSPPSAPSDCSPQPLPPTAHFWGDLDGLRVSPQLTFLELSCVAGNAVPASLQGMPLLAHLVLPWAQSDPARVVPSLSALRELEIGTGALRIEPQPHIPQTTPHGPPPPPLCPPSPAPRCAASPSPSTSSSPPVCRPTPASSQTCSSSSSFAWEGSFGWGNGAVARGHAEPHALHQPLPLSATTSYLLHRLAPSLKFLHLEDPLSQGPTGSPPLPHVPHHRQVLRRECAALLPRRLSALHTLASTASHRSRPTESSLRGEWDARGSQVLQFRFAQIHALPEFVRGFTSVVRVDLINCGPLEVWPEFLAKFRRSTACE
ncbi:unnamed protein product [Closterium sp. NIES-64]|nr:unnamed protein product [Closterium sp. NIES-64]